jgi:hypothetical protein
MIVKYFCLQDGSHIKGLLINFVHHNWPELLRLPFLEEFITPIVKATKGDRVTINLFRFMKYLLSFIFLGFFVFLIARILRVEIGYRKLAYVAYKVLQRFGYLYLKGGEGVLYRHGQTQDQIQTPIGPSRPKGKV